MQPKCFLLALAFVLTPGYSQIWETGLSIPQLYPGKVPPNGKPYQIVRIIEYVVPYPYETSPRLGEPRAPTVSLRSIKPPISHTTTKPKAAKNFRLKVIHDRKVICSGALISTRLVLTSAHCFNLSNGNQSLLAGEYKLQASKSRIYEVSNIIFGTKLDKTEDMALMVLKLPLQDALIQPIELCEVPLRPKDNVIIYMSRKKLKFLQTQVIANRNCKRSYASDELTFITQTMICVQNLNRKADCQTIKGDLLLHQDRLCGIDIYGEHCSEGAINGELYADVFQAREQLQRTIKLFQDDVLNK